MKRTKLNPRYKSTHMCHYLAGPIHGISVVAECIECKLDLTKEDRKDYEAPIEQ